MNNFYNENMTWIQEHTDHCFINRNVFQKSDRYHCVETKEEYVSLIACRNNEEIAIHSKMYPMREAENVVEHLDFKCDLLYILGFGLGYIATFIRKKYPEKKIILIEPETPVFYLALKQSNLSQLQFDQIFVGYNDAGIAKHLIRQKDKFDLYVQRSQERLTPLVYRQIQNFLNQKSNFTLGELWKYKKFVQGPKRIIFIDSAYVLTKECLNAIEQTGNLVHYLHIDVENYDYEQFIKKIMHDIVHFKPDFILTINHLGFDREGRLTDLLNELEMPFASWFVDSPKVILSSYELNISDYCHIFVWDEDYISLIQEKGYTNCYFLPLATDPSIFYPQEKAIRYNVSFVGSSMLKTINKNMLSWGHREEMIQNFRKRADELLYKFKSESLVFRSLSPKKYYRLPENEEQEEDFLAAVLWKATQIYRQSGIDQLKSFQPVVAGDPYWAYSLPLEYELLPERWYYDNLVDFYNESKINFNMTSLQMTSAVNQRVFDVSACRKFLLSDYRKQISDYFVNQENMVWFSDVKEIPELLSFYLNHEELLEKIATKAYHIVLQHHTYKHRLQTMIDILQKRYAG